MHWYENKDSGIMKRYLPQGFPRWSQSPDCPDFFQMKGNPMPSMTTYNWAFHPLVSVEFHCDVTSTCQNFSLAVFLPPNVGQHFWWQNSFHSSQNALSFYNVPCMSHIFNPHWLSWHQVATSTRVTWRKNHGDVIQIEKLRKRKKLELWSVLFFFSQV